MPHGQGVRKNAGASYGEVSTGFTDVCTSGHKRLAVRLVAYWIQYWSSALGTLLRGIDRRPPLADEGVFDLKNWELSVWQKDRYHQWTVREIWRHQDPFLCAKAIEIMKACLLPLIVEDRRQ